MFGVSGVFNGTGADVYICIGFIPDKIVLTNIMSADSDELVLQLHWTKEMMRATDTVEGIGWDAEADSDADFYDLAATEGVLPYYGGVTLTSTNQTSTSYGEGVYLGWDKADYRYGPGLGPYANQDAVADTIDTWTLDTSGSMTGHFNEDVTGTYIGEGSPICIDGRWYTITDLTATEGEGTDEVTLNADAPSGAVQCIRGKYDLAPLALGTITPPGFRLDGGGTFGAKINRNDKLVAFECYKFD